MKRLLRTLQIFLILNWIQSYQSIDFLKECSTADEGHETRGSFTCCSQSPVALQSALDFRNGWRKCAVPPKNRNEDPVISAWRVYRCILFMGLKGKPLLPSTYARHLTAKYPPKIKSEIVNLMSELEDDDMTFEVDIECLKRTPYPKVTMIRNLFYEIEQAVCEGDDDSRSKGLSIITTTEPPWSNRTRKNNGRRNLKLFEIFKKISSYSPSELAEVLCETCERRQEMFHRNGDCCSQVPIPFPFILLPYRYANQDKVRQCAEDVVNDVGLPADTVFAGHLKHLCYTSCEHFLSGTILESDLWNGVQLLQSKGELKILTKKMLPKYFSTRYNDELVQFVLDNFRGAWQETKTFESKEKLSQRDIRNYDKEKLRNLLASCKASRLIETVTNLYLNNLCFEEYASSSSDRSRPNNTNSQRPSSSSHNAHSPHHGTPLPPTDGGGRDDVIVNFDWNPDDHGHPSTGGQAGNGYSQQQQPKRPSSSSSSRSYMRPAASGWK